MKSTVYLVGAGPGDPKLITIRGLELIQKADCIIYDYLANPKLLESAKPGASLIYVGKKSGQHYLTQDKINQLLVQQAKLHQIIVRLKGGDPFIFGRGAEEALFLKKHNIRFEVVPGITSAIAPASFAGIPLTARDKNSTVGFITGNEDPTKKESNINWDALAKGLGTMVFLMGVANLEKITRKLIACGKPENTPVAVIRWGTTPKQKTVIGNLKNIAELAKKNKITPPAVIVVGEVVKLRAKLNWFENKPLFAKKIIVTRTRKQASKLSEKLSDLGAEIIEIPTIKIVSLNADKKISEAFKKNNYDWVIFTSANGVSEFAWHLKRQKKDSRILANTKIAAIGPETSSALGDIGIAADFVPKEFRAEGIIRYFKSQIIRRRAPQDDKPFRILILRAKEARDILPIELKKMGATVDVIALYKNILPKESAQKIEEAFKQKIDLITFTSSSTVANFIKLAGKNYRQMLKGTKVASIGPITSQTIKNAGLKVTAQAKVYTIDGLVDAITKH